MLLRELLRRSEGYAGGQWGCQGYIGVEGDFEGFGVLSSWVESNPKFVCHLRPYRQ